jgi:hypothetical protein
VRQLVGANYLFYLNDHVRDRGLFPRLIGLRLVESHNPTNSSHFPVAPVRRMAARHYLYAVPNTRDSLRLEPRDDVIFCTH